MKRNIKTTVGFSKRGAFFRELDKYSDVMKLPKFLLGDNTDFPKGVYIVHTEYPRFVINLETDEVEWFEEFSTNEREDLESEARTLVEQAMAFYDREIGRYEE